MIRPLILAVALMGGASMAPAASAVTCSPKHVIVYEDDPCWTWPKMGNRKRGVIDQRTWDAVVVGPCEFARGVRSHRFKPGGMPGETNQALRGDTWALVHGCER